MPDLELYFLGSPQVKLDDAPVTIGSRKALGLLAYLALSRQSHSRDALGALLWPESDQSRARAYLRHALWTLNKEVGEEGIHATREQIGLNPEAAVWVDVTIFRELVSRTRTHEHGQGAHCADCLAWLAEAADHYRGDFLAGFTLSDAPAFDEWQFFQCEELRQMLAGALERLVQAHTRQRAYQPAITYARRWVALDPLHEPSQRVLMRLYALAGQQAAALRQYRECVRLLEEELRVEPQEGTTALYEAIRTHQLVPADTVGATEVAGTAVTPPEDTPLPTSQPGAFPPSTPASAPLFVARQQELARLDGILHTVLGGETRVAFVLGEAGQGKTALLQAFARRAQEAHPHLIVAGGNCNAYTGLGDPHLPFREILAYLTADVEAWSSVSALHPDHAHRVQRMLPHTAQALVETAPDLIDAFVPIQGLLDRVAAANLSGATWWHQLQKQATSPAGSAGGNVQQNALFEQYSRLLQTVARRVPLLLILDDLQWADPGSVSLLFHLGRRLADCPVFVLGAYRPDEVAMGQDGEPHPLARVTHELQRIFGDISVDLGQAEGKAFIDAWLDREPNRLGSFFRQTLYRQTGGYPLFTIELLRAMQERGDLIQDEAGVWEMNTEINWNTMPARVEGAIGERIDRLAPSLQEWLQVASVEGEEFTAEVVAQVLHLDERQVVRQLSRELDKVHALVQAVGMRHTGQRRLSRYRFRHILIQRYLYSALDEVQRTYQHEMVGSALEMLVGGQDTEVAVQLARHFEIAQIPEKAASYLHLAGDQARRAAALSEAIRYYQAALTHWPDTDQAGRARITRKLGECQWMTGHAQDALKTFEAGYSLFRALDNIEEAGAMQRLIGRVYWEVGDREKSLHHYHQALSILEQIPDSVELAWAVSSISQMHMLAAEYDEAIAWGERALTQAERLDAEAVIVHALNNMGTAYLSGGEPERGRAMLQESIRRALDANLPHDACRGRLNLGESLASLDYYEEARATFEELYTYADRVHTILYAGSSLIELSRLDWLNGRWRAALARRPLITEWLERGQSMTYLDVIASTVTGWQSNDLGQPAAAYRVLTKSLPKVYSFDELQMTAPHLAQMARALAAGEERTEAIKVIRELLAVLERGEYDSRFSTLPFLFICHALPERPEPDLIDDVVAALENLERVNAPIQSPSRTAALHEARGMVALRREMLPQAVESFREAVALWQTVERPYDLARALNELGQVLVLTGNSTEARHLLTRGSKIVEELAVQLDDGETKATFLNSSLVQEIRHSLAGLGG